MTLLPFRRDGADDDALLRRARRGDRRAHRLFARRHAARAVELVGLLVDGSAESTELAAAVLDATIAGGRSGDDALVRCAVQVLAPAAGERGLGRLVLALTDIEGRTPDTVAELVGRDAEEVTELRASALSGLGATPPVARDCRGWALAARRDRLTVSEREAAHGHLQLCATCRARLEEQRRTRDTLRASGAAAGAVVVADVVALSMPAGGLAAGAGGLASVVVGKAGAAAIGAAAVAIAATSIGVAATRETPAPGGGPAVVRDGQGHSRPASATTTQPRDVGTTTPAPPGQTGPLPVPVPTQTGRLAPPALATPALTPVTTVLPTTLPVPLPTGVLSVVPLPSVSATPTLPITLPTDILPTATSLLGH